MEQEKQYTSEITNEIDKRLIEEFQDSDVREIYCNEFLNAKIATQIKVLREQRTWTQEELATHAVMKQERVAVLENVNYESWTLSVLRRFAKAYDLAIDVEFKEFGEFLKEFESFGKEKFEKRSFKDDPVFNKQAAANPALNEQAKENVRQFPTLVRTPVVNPTSGALTLPMLVEVPRRKDFTEKPHISDSTLIDNKIPPIKSGARFYKTA